MCNHNKSHESHNKSRKSHDKSSLVTCHAGALRCKRLRLISKLAKVNLQKRYWVCLRTLLALFAYGKLLVKGIAMSFHQKKSKKNFFSDSNLSCINLYISAAISLKKMNRTIKYWKFWWYPYRTPLKFNKLYLIFL